MKFEGWRRTYTRGYCSLLHPESGLWPLQGCPRLAVTQWWHVWGLSKIQGWCVVFLSHCRCHHLLLCMAVGNRVMWQRSQAWVTSRSTLPDWRFHPSSIFPKSSLLSSLLMLAYLTAEGLWWMMLKSNKQSVYICSSKQRTSTANQRTLHPIYSMFSGRKYPLGSQPWNLLESGWCAHILLYLLFYIYF